jgi:hypothetical protein
MNWLKLTILFSSVLLLSNICYSQDKVVVDSTSYNNLLGLERSDVKAKLNIDFLGGTVIGWVEPSPKPIITHIFSHANFDDKVIMILEKVIGSEDQSTENKFFAVDQLVISANDSEYYMSYLGCTINGQSFYPEGEIIALHKGNGEKIATNILKAWKADFQKNKFTEISKSNIQCNLDGTYYFKLSAD